MNKDILSQKRITATEKEILEYLVLGMKNKEIAKKMLISVSTVKKHLESIYYKFGVHNRMQAIYIAFIEK